MDKAKRQRLEAAGWKVTSVEDFLGLTAEESAEIEARLAAVAENEATDKAVSEEQAQRLPTKEKSCGRELVPA